MEEEVKSNNESENNDNPTASLYGIIPDITMPDIPLPTAPEPKEETNKDECDVAFKFAFVGAGQGGSRIAEAFHRLGYRKLSAINTAHQDLNTINLDHKLCIGDGGAGKNPDVAKAKFADHKEDVLDFMRDVFGEDFDRFFVCAGAGGGTGAGTVVPLIHTTQELYDAVKSPTKKVGVI